MSARTRPNQWIGSQVPDIVLLFTATVGANFIIDLFPKRLSQEIRTNSNVKHIMAIGFLLLTVVWTQDSVDLAQALGLTIAAYVWFLCLFDLGLSEALIVLGLLMGTYILNKKAKNPDLSPEALQNVQMWEQITMWSGVGLTGLFLVKNWLGIRF